MQEANALIASPGLHPREAAVDQAHGCEPVESRIDPAIQGDIRRALIGGSGVSITAKHLADRSPCLTAQSRIMMAAVHILGDEIAHNAADEDVGRKMLVSTNSGVVHERCQTLDHDFHRQPRVLVCDYPRYRPCRR